MKDIFTMAIIITMMTFGLTACSEYQLIASDGNSQNHDSSDMQVEKIVFDSLEVGLIKNTTALHPNLQDILDQAKVQKGYLILKGSDLTNSDTTLVFIGSGQKNTGGYDIKIETIQADEKTGQLDIVVKEIAPNPGDIVTEAITYPHILFLVKGDYNSFKITDINGNEFKPVNIQGPKLPGSEIINDLSNAYSTFDKSDADALVERFISALNMEDSRSILECLNPEMLGYYTTETVETAISDYKICFKNSPIVQYKLISDTWEINNSLVYQLISETGNTSEIKVVAQEGTMWIECELLDYSYHAKHLLERFIYALERENERLLAQVLTVDDLDYPLSNVPAIIEKYKEHFDLESLDYRFMKIDSKQQAFLYCITGQKKGKPAEHQIKILYGDELIRLEDPWVPSKNERDALADKE